MMMMMMRTTQEDDKEDKWILTCHCKSIYMPFQIVSDGWQDGNFLATNSMDNTVSQSTFQQLPLSHLHSACNHETFESFRTMKCQSIEWGGWIRTLLSVAGPDLGCQALCWPKDSKPGEVWGIFPALAQGGNSKVLEMSQSGAHFTQTNLDIVYITFRLGEIHGFWGAFGLFYIFVHLGPFSFSI